MIFLAEYLGYYLDSSSEISNIFNKDIETSLGNDIEVRRSIRQQKLTKILQLQQLERDSEAKKSVKCIFCREFSGKLQHHSYL
jgi:hypothetical protein